MLSIEKQNKAFNEQGFKTPVLIMDKTIIKQKYEKVKNSLPQANVYYAVKANPHPEILQLLNELGAGFEIASLNELKELLKNYSSDTLIDMIIKESDNKERK